MKHTAAFVALVLLAAAPLSAQKKVMLMDRLGPTKSVLYLANADGSDEHPLFPSSGFDYDASFSTDGKWIIFTSERSGAGQADLYRVHPDGSGLDRLTDNPAVDDQGVVSPDGTELAFVSTRNSPLHNANIWIMNLKTKQARNLTGGSDLQSKVPDQPNAFLRPAWSPDGKWIAFSSDRNTKWRGAEEGAGDGHFQELSIYIIQSDGNGLRRLTPAGISAGSPKWSADGKTIICYEMDPKDTFGARMGPIPNAPAQIVTIDVATGQPKSQTSGPGLKVSPQFLPDGRIGYVMKGKQYPMPQGFPGQGGAGRAGRGPAGPAAPSPGIVYIDGTRAIDGQPRNPAWSPDGKLIVYEKQDYTPRQQNEKLYSWDPQREYRYTDVFPALSSKGKLVVSDMKNMLHMNMSVVVMNPDGSDAKVVFDDPTGGAMTSTWSPDGSKLIFGFGTFFHGRDARPARLIMVNADGSEQTDVTGKTADEPNSGFPSWSPDGKFVVFRVWAKDTLGLRIMNLSDPTVRVLTTTWDNFPFWSPDGQRILFTRQQNLDFDLFTIRPDGTDLKQLTNSPGSDAHATWTNDGKQIFFESSRSGFKDEAALYDNSPQPYAQVFIMNADGSDQHQLTDSRWEDSMAVYVTQPDHTSAQK